MVTGKESVEVLRSVPLFADVPIPALKRVLGFSRTVTHPPGDVILRQGSGARALHVIISGKAEVSADGTSIASLGPGDIFGEIAVIDDSRRTASVAAVTELRVLAIDAISFRRLVRSDPGLASALPAEISKRLRELDQLRKG
jgi:CRP-like cAMP-binding protein